MKNKIRYALVIMGVILLIFGVLNANEVISNLSWMLAVFMALMAHIFCSGTPKVDIKQTKGKGSIEINKVEATQPEPVQQPIIQTPGIPVIQQPPVVPQQQPQPYIPPAPQPVRVRRTVQQPVAPAQPIQQPIPQAEPIVLEEQEEEEIINPEDVPEEPPEQTQPLILEDIQRNELLARKQRLEAEIKLKKAKESTVKAPATQTAGFTCQFCGEKQSNKHRLNMHIISKHQEEFNKRMGG